jgi:hypothetical protein
MTTINVITEEEVVAGFQWPQLGRSQCLDGLRSEFLKGVYVEVRV